MEKTSLLTACILLCYISFCAGQEQSNEGIGLSLLDLPKTNPHRVQPTDDAIQMIQFERLRQIRSAEFLQNSIRQKTESAASVLNQEEYLQRETFLADAQLTAMRAKRKALQERLDNPNSVSRLMLWNAMQQDPELQRLNTTLEEVKNRQRQLMEILKKPEDPRFAQLKKIINEIEEQIQQLSIDQEGFKEKEITAMLRLQTEQEIYVLDQSIRVQEILVEELTKKRIEQMVKSGCVVIPHRQSEQLRFQGGSFADWANTLRMELDPKERIEAVRALATFGANGNGKEAMEAILGIAKNYDFSVRDTQSSPVTNLRIEILLAFAYREMHIPFGDSMPKFFSLLAEGSDWDRRFVIRVLDMQFCQFREDSPPQELIDNVIKPALDLLVQGDLPEMTQKVLINMLAGFDSSGKWTLPYLLEEGEKSPSGNIRTRSKELADELQKVKK